MIRRIFFCLLILSVHYKGFAFTKLQNQGSLYFPVVWEISSPHKLNSSDFSLGTMTFLNTKTGKKVVQPFENKDVISNNTLDSVVFFGKKINDLASGSYDLISFDAVYKSQSSDHQVKLNNVYKVNFNVVNDKITILGGVFVRSSVDDNSKNSLSVPIIRVNDTSLNYNDLLEDISKEKLLPRFLTPGSKKSDTESLDYINFSNPTSPILVKSFSSQEESENLLQYGIFVTTPCPFQGIFEISLQYEKEPVFYSKDIKVNQETCNDKMEYNYPIKFLLKAGKWTIRNVSLVSRTQSQQFLFNSPSYQKILNFYKTDSAKFLIQNAYSKTINDELFFNIEKDYSSKPLYYVGMFEWQLNKEKKPDVFFVRSVVLSEIRKSFRSKQIYNGYTGDRMTRSTYLGTTSLLFENINIANVSQERVNTLKSFSKKNISFCLDSIYKINPLFYINGDVLFYSDELNNYQTKSKMDFPNNVEIVQKFQECLVSRFKNLPNVNGTFEINADIFSL